MFQKSSGKSTMKWVSLLRDFKEKVGISQSQPPSSANSPSSSASPSSFHNQDNNNEYALSIQDSAISSPSRDKHELELDFKRYWEEFRSSSSEKEKEKALNLTVDVFCRLVKQHTNVAQLITMLVETHVFSFVVGRAFVSDIEKLKISSKTRSLDVDRVLEFFMEETKDSIRPGSNLLHAVEILVSGPIDKQSLLDSGILCCMIHILGVFLGANEGKVKQKTTLVESLPMSENSDGNKLSVRRFEVEGSVVHIMKALASHPSAAQSLIEDNSLQLLFQMVANGSLLAFSQYKEGLVPLHSIQLHRHAMQILGLLLVNDNGCTAKYIRKHQLIKVLLMAVKDFKPDCGDPAYTMGIVDMLLECVELSYRHEAGGIMLREDIHNAHGYQFLVHFALVLSKNQGFQEMHSSTFFDQDSAPESLHASNDVGRQVVEEKWGDTSPQSLSPSLSRLLDVIVNLAQTGLADTIGSAGSKGFRNSHKPSGHGRRRTSSSDRFADDIWEKDNYKVKDLEAVQMLQDIFLKADSRELQAEVLNRMFKIFSSHLENYKLCQQLRTVPLLILNMAGFPSSLQEIILKILEYAVTVVNCIPEQELLSLCCLLQQPITAELKLTIMSFFVKLLSFDQQYKKVLREVGVLEVLLDDLKQHKFLLGLDQHNSDPNQLERKSSSSSLQKHMDSKDAILSSPKLLELGSGKFPLFEVDETIAVAWDCLVSLLKKAEANQASFRSANGVTATFPFMISDIHRPGVLRVLSCLIIEDTTQAHPEELGALVEVSKSGMVTSALGSQYKLADDAKCDTFGALWRILGANNSAQRVFGEATGFSLLLTTLHGFQSDEGQPNQSYITVYMKLFTYLLRLMTIGVCDNAINRAKLHAIISSQTFFELLSESGLICADCERQVIQLLFELALEIVIPPFLVSESATSSDIIENGSASFLVITPSGSFSPNKERVYNAGAVRVLIRSLLLFTPKVQLEVLDLIEKLARAGPFNQENLTSAGCVELLLEIIYPFLSVSSSLLSHALKIVEVLGAYRLSASELRVLVRYILQMRLMNSGRILVAMMERLVLLEDMASENVSLAPFVEMDMSKIGHASIQVSMGERSWPPAAGYSFVCWFQYRSFLNSHAKEIEVSKAGSSKRQNHTSGQHNGPHVLRIFAVGAADSGNTFYAELCLQEDGSLTLATSSSSSLSFSGLEMEEGRWHHLAVVHSKPNALAGLFQASVAYVYLNGKLSYTGKLGYSPSPAGKSLQVTIGTPVTCARISELSWKLRSCHLFEEVLSPGAICFMYILGRGYRGLFQDMDLLRFVPNQACGGGSMAILDSLDTELPLASNTQRSESAIKQGNLKADRSGIVWDMEMLGNLSLQLSGKKLIFAFDGTCTEAFRASGTMSMLNLVDPVSAAASPIGGIPRFGRLHGDIYVCKQCVIGDGIGTVGGMAVVLALVEAAETRDMLHMALTLLACALHQNPQNVREMQTNRDIVKGSMYRESCGLSVKTTVQEEGGEHAIKHIDSPRPLHWHKSFQPKVRHDGSLRVLAKLQDAPWNTKEQKYGSPPVTPRDAPRYSYDERESRDKLKSTTKLKELPRLSLDSRERSIRNSASQLRSNNLSREIYSESGISSQIINLNQEPGSNKRPSTIVARLMGLEPIPDFIPTDNDQMMKMESCLDEDSDTISRSSRICDESKQKQVSGSPRISCKIPASPQLRNVMKSTSSSRFPQEPAPWRQTDGNQCSQKQQEFKYHEASTNIPHASPSVYGEIKKRLTDLEFKKSGKDLRALKQIHEAMEKTSARLGNKKEEPILNSESHTSKCSPYNSFDRASTQQMQSNYPVSPSIKGSSSPRRYGSQIVVMKPTKLHEKPANSHCKPGLQKKWSGDNADNIKDLVGRRTAKDITHRKNHLRDSSCVPQPSIEKKTNAETQRSSQHPKAPKYMRGENPASFRRSSGTLSPRLQQKTQGTEKLSCLTTQSSGLRRARKQSIKQPMESGSPTRKYIQKYTNLQQGVDQLSWSSSEPRNLSHQGDTVSQQSDSGISLASHSDIEVTSTDHTKQITGPYQLKDPNEEDFTARFTEDGLIAELTTATLEQPSPVSVLDTTFYEEDCPSPVKKMSTAFQDYDTLNIDEAEWNAEYVDHLQSSRRSYTKSKFDRGKLENIDNLVHKLQLMNSAQDEAAKNYIESLCDNTNPDHRYIAEILVAADILIDLGSRLTTIQLHPSGLSVNPNLFHVLEIAMGSSEPADKHHEKGARSISSEQIRRKLVFDVVNEILVHKSALAGSGDPWIFQNKMGGRSMSGEKLIKELCSKLDHQQPTTESNLDGEDDGLTRILSADMMNEPEHWGDYTSELPGIVLDIERLIFKDLIGEVVSGGAAVLQVQPGRHCRKLFSK